MAWIALFAWIAAVVLAVVVLGFCAYELRWKTRRLRTDMATLQGDADALRALQARLTELAAAQSAQRAVQSRPARPTQSQQSASARATVGRA